MTTLPDVAPPERSDITWRVKPSTFCNLRCRYCYEWDRLADHRRMTLPDWRRVCGAAAEHRVLVEQRRGSPIDVHVVIQGGEPLLLPVRYLRAVHEICREELGSRARIGILTNLSIAPPQVIEFIRQNGIGLTVSWDGVPGPRLDLAGQPTGERVVANL